MKLFCFSAILGILLLIGNSCGVERQFAKIRSEKGNELYFVYFHREIKHYPVEIKDERISKTDSTQLLYFGGQFEVSNRDYWRFLNHLKTIDSVKLYQKHRPKSERWIGIGYSLEDSMALHYDDQSIYRNYPVVNITPEDAQAYINWLNDIEPDTTVHYSLFTPDLWAKFFNSAPESDSTFSWETNQWRRSDYTPLGNFAEFDQNQIRYNHLTDKVHWHNSDSLGYSSIVNGPLECWKFDPNNWGAYNVSGNVAELINSFYYIDSTWYCTTTGGSWHSPVYYLRKNTFESYELPSPFVGFRVLKTQYKRWN